MKKLLIAAVAIMTVFICGYFQEQNIVEAIRVDDVVEKSKEERNYRNDMREFVKNISEYAKELNPNFLVIPQNGHELITMNGQVDGEISISYLDAIDGIGREDLFFGYDEDNQITSKTEQAYIMPFMELAEKNGVEVLVTDYCWTESFVDESYNQSEDKGFISFAADQRDLTSIPNYPNIPYHVNNDPVDSLSQAKNFLYMINPSAFNNKEAFIKAIQKTNYDIVLIDLFYDGDSQLSSSEIESLRVKLNGGSRLVIAYMSIGEAEDYRYYWKEEWSEKVPSWLDGENLHWPGNYKVHYWNKNWQSLIYGNDESYVKRILDSGFDGVYLDIIDAFEYFEGEND